MRVPLLLCPGLVCCGALLLTEAAFAQSWIEWGADPQHSGATAAHGQHAARRISEIVYDPFVPMEQAEMNGELTVHYQAPLVDGNDLFMAFKTGVYIPCTPPGSGAPDPCGVNAWNWQVWGESRYEWQRDKLVEKWSYQTDWKPEPTADGLGGWEPVFSAAVAGPYVYVPAFGGAVAKLNRADGTVVAKIDPFAGKLASTSNVYVAGPLTADNAGNIFYNAIQLNVGTETLSSHPYTTDVVGSWLVKVAADGTTSTATFASLTPGAPAGSDKCLGSFGGKQLPWPPAPNATPDSSPCGSQRPGINVAPAIGYDGTIYTVSRAHLNPRYAYLVAVNSDLSPKWIASLRDRLHDGCGTSTLPANGSPGGCREGAKTGVDPSTNQLPAGSVVDQDSSSPVVAPDGSVLLGAYTRYNYSRGHLFHFSAGGEFLNAYDFGWDITPAIYRHDGTYSIIIKDNHYDTGSYCVVDSVCPPAPPGPFYVTQLSPQLQPEWSFQNTNTLSCSAAAGGVPTCVSDHPGGFEWCVNAPAVDASGKVYANSEDGRVYVIKQGGALDSTLFLNLAIGAAYTPIAIGPDGRIYTQNDGRLFVVGDARPFLRR